MGLVERGSESLTEAEGEDDFAISKVGGDLGDAPFAWCRAGLDLSRRKAGGKASEALGGSAEDGHGVLAVKVAGVRV